MLVRSRDKIFRMKDLKGKKIGLSKSLNRIKNDWWRIQEHQGIELMLMMNDMTMNDIQLVEFPYADDWYNNPRMLEPLYNPSDLWLQRDHKRDLAFRPLETALEKGVVDAIYTQSKPLQQLSEATGKFAAIEDLSRYPDWRLQVANIPAPITCSDVMAEKHPELAVAFMKGMIRVGRWANEHKRAAAAILDRQTFYLDVDQTYRGHQAHRPGAEPVAPEPGLGRDRQGLHAEARLHQERLRRAQVGRTGVPRTGGQGTAGRRMEEENHFQASQDGRGAGVRQPAWVVSEEALGSGLSAPGHWRTRAQSREPVLSLGGCYHMRNIGLASLAFIVALAAGSPAQAQAPASGSWQVTIAPYFLGASMTGTVTVKGQELDVDMSFSDILDHLQFGAMGLVVARKGNWGFGGDAIWMSLGAEGTSPGPLAITGSADVNQGAFSFYGLRRLAPVADLMFGVRVNTLQADLRFNGPGQRSADGSKTWVDPIVGVQLHTPENGRRWHAQVYSEVGGFGAGSDFTWQVFPTFGVNLAKWVSIDFGYRWLGIDYSSGENETLFEWDVLTQGPLIGFAFKF